MEDHNQVESTEGTESDSSNVLVDLNFEETRVLGSLIEKELTTPEYYLLTLNSLVSACNQKITVYQSPISMKPRFPRQLKS